MEIKSYIMKMFRFLLLFVFTFTSFMSDTKKPVLYIIGDSTVKNGSGKGEGSLWGWGSIIQNYFDLKKIDVENRAIGGRSSRTFLTEGRWDSIMKVLTRGDYVIMQFGHNDSGPLDDTARARGTIKGIGADSVEIYNPIRKQKEVVYTYGYYMRKFVYDAKLKGAIPIICSPVPRNQFKEGKVMRSNDSYTLWAKQIAGQTHSYFIDLHNMVSDVYDRMGEDSVATFFPADHTHPNYNGSALNASLVVKGIKTLKHCDLKKYLKYP